MYNTAIISGTHCQHPKPNLATPGMDAVTPYLHQNQQWQAIESPTVHIPESSREADQSTNTILNVNKSQLPGDCVMDIRQGGMETDVS